MKYSESSPYFNVSITVLPTCLNNIISYKTYPGACSEQAQEVQNLYYSFH